MRRGFLFSLASAGLLVFSTFAWPCSAAPSLTAKGYPEFIEINGIDSLEDGSFVVVGLLRSEVGTTRSGLLHISSTGEALGPVVELRNPEDKYLGVVATDVKRLPGGDVVVCGWVALEDGDTDLWLSRLAIDGSERWSTFVPTDDLQQKLYKVELLSTGEVISVGRSQYGPGDKPAHGIAVWLNAEDGVVRSKSVSKFVPDSCPEDESRCAFQDVVELGDGNLVFAGWVTKGKTDDIWVLKTNAGGSWIETVTSGDEGSDVAFAVGVLGDSILVVGTMRKVGQESTVALSTFDLDLSNRTPIDLSQSTNGQARGVLPLAVAKQFLIAGQLDDDSESNGFIASLNSGSHTAEVIGVAKDGSAQRFVDMAMNNTGEIALAGFAGAQGTVGFYNKADQCVPDETVEKLSLDETRQKGCALADRPKRFNLSGAKSGGVVVIRPTVGDIDAVLLRGEKIVESSLNTNGAPELLVLPADLKDLELSVVANAPSASFDIEVVALEDDPGQDASGNGLSHTKEDALLTDFALRTLGYDVGGERVELANGVRTFDTQAVLAFQAAEGFPLTGKLTPEERTSLLDKAARRVELLGQQAAANARKLAALSPIIKPLDDNYDSVTGVLAPEGNYGTAVLKTGGSFTGLLQGELSSPVPVLGVWNINSSCTFTFGVADGFDAPYSIYNPGAGTLGVLRSNGEIVSSGEFFARPPLAHCPKGSIN